MMGGEAVDNFVERAVTAASDDEAAVLGGGAGGNLCGVAGAGGCGEGGVNASGGEDVARLVELSASAVAAVAGVGIVDHLGVLEVGGHAGFNSSPCVSEKDSFYIIAGRFRASD